MTSLMGIAKPRFWDTAPLLVVVEPLALTRPISSPRPLNRPPPELPGLMAASVWIRLIALPSTSTERSTALTMPSVTLPLRVPIGLPTATTVSPTASALLSPIVAGVRPVASILSTATSDEESEPITVAGYSVSSDSCTVMEVAPSTTWAQVKMRPSSLRITPEPAPLWI